MAKSFTPEQKSAIDTRDKTLLVSAGAGSGKTFTLTERIIESLLDKENPLDISRMLIVTFTRAAVGELKERISAAIKRALLENPDNDSLEKQFFMLPGAKISTIDSFCNDIFKNNAERFGISPKYRIADPIEASLLSHNVFSSLINAVYEGELEEEVASAEEFDELASSLASIKRENDIESLFIKVYKDVDCLIEGVDVFERFARELTEFAKSPEESTYIKFIKDTLHSALDYHSHACLALRDILIPTEDTKSKLGFVNTLTEASEYLDKINRKESYDALREALTVAMPNASTVSSKEETPELILAKKTRNDAKDELSEIYSLYFKWSLEEWSEAFSRLASMIRILHRFLKKFDELYFGEKKRRSMLEYSDIERLAYDSLYNSDGSLTEYAIAQKELYDAVYIDEYQDVNALQDAIFTAVARDDNRFMVGDIKQSIYCFRGASPDIFARMKEEFPVVKSAGKSTSASIFLSENFRCDRPIVNIVNEIFDKLFTHAKESIGYVSSDVLKFGKYKNPSDEPSTILPKVKVFTSEDESDDDEAPEMPEYVAKEIKRLISEEKLSNGEPIKPSDIAILLRKDGGYAAIYKEALAAEGIKADTGSDKEFFFNSEVQLALCLLSTIDNPRRDIYLAGLMRSPLFDFSADELLLIKRQTPRDCLWSSLLSYVKKNENYTKGISFINTINKYRSLAEGMATDELLTRLYAESGLLPLAARMGSRENLMLLYNYAREFEKNAHKGLYSFISYVNTAIARKENFKAAKSDADTDSVKITTIHHSKGLEYPVVFIVNAGTRLISTMDKKEPYRLSKKLGMAMKLKMRSLPVLLESPIYNVIDRFSDKEAREEELRVYYVALTRARERLYVVGKAKAKSKEDLLAKCELYRKIDTPYVLTKLSSLLDILLYSASSYELAATEKSEIAESDETSIQADSAPTLDTESADADKKEDGKERLSLQEDELEKIAERLTHEYENKHLTTLPEKMSISAVYPAVLDESQNDVFSISFEREDEEDIEKTKILPEFRTGKPKEESARRGIATHTFLQFLNLERFMNTSAKEELEALVREGFISNENARRVRLEEVEAFKHSKLFTQMTLAKSVRREFRFNVRLPASLFTEDEEKARLYKDKEILLQGVIDCIIEDADGELHLIDYKTDRLSKDELLDRSLAEKTLGERYSLQLSYYSLAIKKIFGKAPKTHLGKTQSRIGTNEFPTQTA